MNIMSLDAEYNQPSKKCIQIGAAIFNTNTAELVDSLEIYVNPGEPISKEITDLTGITDSDVSGGISIIEAYEELKKFHAKYKCYRNPILWGSGYSNDSAAIYEQYRSAAGLPEDKDPQQTDNFMGSRVLDVKTIYQSAAISKKSQYAGSLENSMNKLGLEFEGTAHRALTDAINTFRIWFHLMKVYRNEKN